MKIPTSGVEGLNPFLFIGFMSLYEILMVSLLSMIILEFKLLERMLFPLHGDLTTL